MSGSKVTRNFQVTVPKGIREYMELNEGDEVLFMIEDGEVKMVRREEDIIRETSGIWSENSTAKRDEWEERRERELE